MKCRVCGSETALSDTTTSNVDTRRCGKGDHTGNIYECLNESCGAYTLENLLTGETSVWSY